MHTQKGPFRYDIVGSFLRPAGLKEAREQFAAGTITKEALTQVENDCITTLIAQEKEAGLHAVTDGEFRRRWWHLDFLAGLNGVTVYDFETAGFGVKKMMQGTYLSGPISFSAEHPFLEHFRFTRQAAGDTLVKQTIPGPNMVTLDSVVLSQQYKAAPVYPDLDAPGVGPRQNLSGGHPGLLRRRLPLSAAGRHQLGRAVLPALPGAHPVLRLRSRPPDRRLRRHHHRGPEGPPRRHDHHHPHVQGQLHVPLAV